MTEWFNYLLKIIQKLLVEQGLTAYITQFQWVFLTGGTCVKFLKAHAFNLVGAVLHPHILPNVTRCHGHSLPHVAEMFFYGSKTPGWGHTPADARNWFSGKLELTLLHGSGHSLSKQAVGKEIFSFWQVIYKKEFIYTGNLLHCCSSGVRPDTLLTSNTVYMGNFVPESSWTAHMLTVKQNLSRVHQWHTKVPCACL